MIRFDTPLRTRHDRYVEQLVDRPALAVDELQRPGAATGQRIAPPEIEYLPYGPRDEAGQVQCEIIGTFGEVQAEYAAIRTGAGVLDSPHRGVIRITGNDRISFLNSMLTAELKDISPDDVRESFWLNRKGRIEADLMLVALGDELLVDVDVHALERTITTLNSFLFAEDVALTNAREDMHRLTLHGRRAMEVIAEAAEEDAVTLENRRSATVTIAGQRVIAARCDQTGEIGLHLFLPRDHAEAIWDALLATDETVGKGKRRIRPIGWHAFNIARIEAGTPLFNIDFATDNLPHETGILNKRVSFTKGCFLGQEVVARMQHLGRPKKVLMGLRFKDDLLPVEGAPVFSVASDQSANADQPVQPQEQAGAVTSSTLSPLIGAQPIAFAVIRSKDAQVGRQVAVEAEGRLGTAVACEIDQLTQPSEPPNHQKPTTPSDE